MPLKTAVPDLVSNSYFPAVAAVELGFFKEEGLDVALELIFPVDKTYAALHDGQIDLVGGSAHSALAAFPEWKGVKLLCAQAQGTYWFLVMRSDLAPQRNDLGVVKGRRIGAAPCVDLALRRLLQEGGIDVERDHVQIMPVPGATPGTGRDTVNFGVTAAAALADGKIDGFCANGMGAEVAVRRGVGTVVLDMRRGDGPKGCFDYTMAAIATTDGLIERAPQTAAAAVCANVKTQAALKQDFRRATSVGEKLFPPAEAALIAELVRRDLPFYDATISEESVAGMNAFARDLGILQGHPAYGDVVGALERVGMPSPFEAVSTYFHAKDGNRPVLMRRAFAEDVQLEMVVKTEAISFPSAARGLAEIEEVLVRRIATDFENVYSFGLARPTEADRRHFSCPWLVSMSARNDGALRVGVGLYDWQFSADPRCLVDKLVITIDVMQILPARELERIMSWISSLPYPWCRPDEVVATIPHLEELSPIERYLKGDPHVPS